MLIRYKIAFLFCLLAGLILAVTGLSVYYFSARERQNTFKLRLKNRAISTAKAASVITDNNYAVLGKVDTGSIASLYNKSTILLNYHNHPVYTYADKNGNEILLTADLIETIKESDVHYFKNSERTAVGIHFLNADNNFIVAVAADDTDGKAFLYGLRKLLILSFCIALLITFITGLLFAKALLKPLGRIIAEVRLISSNNLSQRISEGNNRDELNALAATFNSLLNRMQESFIIQRRFISNASHELSTPLTAISSQLEVILQKDRLAEEYKLTIESVLDDIKEIQLLTRSLLEIAKAGSQGSISLEDVRIDELLLRVAADVQKLKDGYRVNINFNNFPEEEQLLTIFGNNHLLYIAIKNLFENGCKYADDNTANIEVMFSNTSIIIDIASKGDVIADADVDTIFEPFFRADSVRQKHGYGLGLTLTKRILSLHHAYIDVKSNLLEGTHFTVTIPHNP